MYFEIVFLRQCLCKFKTGPYTHAVFYIFLFQEEVYRTTSRFLIPSVISGYNATVFAYGATGKLIPHTFRP